MKALIDSDTPVFSTAICSNEVEEWAAVSRLDYSIERIIEDSGCSSYQLYVGGKGNFRYNIYPEYKANRSLEDPIHRESLRLHLIKSWGAIEAEGCEADDLVGCAQTDDTMICGIDKDLLQIPGRHYQWPIIRGGKTVKEGKFYEISELEGFKRFFSQALTGDTSDNIKGIHRIGPAKASAILADCMTEEDMYEAVLAKYLETYEYEEAIQKLETNLDLLWIWRVPGMTYSIRREVMEND